MAPTSRESEFIDVNERLCRMLGYGKEELISHRMADFTHPGDAALGASEFRLLPKDGKFIYVKHRKNTIRNAAGAPVNRLDIVEDVTEQRRVERELREKADKYLSIVKGLPETNTNLHG